MYGHYRSAIMAHLETWSADAPPERRVELDDSWRSVSDDDLAQTCLTSSNLLYLASEPAVSWRGWMALAAWGFALRGDLTFARAFGTIARETWFAREWLDKNAGNTQRVDQRSFEILLGLDAGDIGELHAVPDETALDLYDEGFVDLMRNDWYALLTESIPANRHEHSALALEQLAKSWLDDQRGKAIDPKFFPGYEPIPGALAALALDSGMSPELLSEKARGFYGPAMLVSKDVAPILPGQVESGESGPAPG